MHHIDNLEPRMLSMDLAVEVGIPEALLLGQLLFWLRYNRERGQNYRDGHYWVYNTYEDWQRALPCFARRTIAAAIARLKKRGFILTGNYNESKWVHKVWYRLDPHEFDFDDSPPKPKILVKDRQGKVIRSTRDGTTLHAPPDKEPVHA